jgi:hypothetical protein
MVTGTDQGEYMGISPTGKSVMYDEIFIFRFTGVRIAETWGVVDVFSRMKERGVIPVANPDRVRSGGPPLKVLRTLRQPREGSRHGQARHPLTRRCTARLLAGLRVLISARLAIPQHNSAVRRAGRGPRREPPMFIKAKMLAVAASAPRPGAVQLRGAVGFGQWR